MRLTLQNGYPYPYPTGISEAEAEDIADNLATLELHGVTHFEWLHTVTVEFDNVLSVLEAQAKTGWKTWDNGLVLEAPQSAADGYGHPAIIARDTAYCGFILQEDA